MPTRKVILRALLALLICGYVAPAQLLNKGNAPAASLNVRPIAPPDSTPTFKSSSRLVVVDVVVTDREGNPIAGLDKSNFTVLEDGKVQAAPGLRASRAG